VAVDTGAIGMGVGTEGEADGCLDLGVVGGVGDGVISSVDIRSSSSPLTEAALVLLRFGLVEPLLNDTVSAFRLVATGFLAFLPFFFLSDFAGGTKRVTGRRSRLCVRDASVGDAGVVGLGFSVCCS
jgi:hypothetical protein